MAGEKTIQKSSFSYVQADRGFATSRRGWYYFSMGSTYILYIHGSDWYIIKGGERSAGYG